jgi:hypothetical protein
MRLIARATLLLAVSPPVQRPFPLVRRYRIALQFWIVVLDYNPDALHY